MSWDEVAWPTFIRTRERKSQPAPPPHAKYCIIHVENERASKRLILHIRTRLHGAIAAHPAQTSQPEHDDEHTHLYIVTYTRTHFEANPLDLLISSNQQSK